MIVAVTGHRPAAFGNDYTLDGEAWDLVWAWFAVQFDELKPARVLTGMALGVDQVAALVCADRGVPFTAVVPFAGQQERWRDRDKQRYADLLAKAAEVTVVSAGGYSAGKMHARNRWMVDRADVLLAVWNGNGGGTASCVEYAERQSVPVRRLAKW